MSARFRRLLALMALATSSSLTNGCRTSPDPADLVLLHGNLVTLDPARPKAQALAARGDLLVAVGSDEEIQKFVGPKTRVIDLEGRLAIPGFIEGGVAGLYPFEVQAGMDIVEVRKRFPQLLMLGGLDKTKVAAGRDAIDAELEAKLPFMLTQGGYIPFCDHLVPPDVPWEHFAYYRERVRDYVARYQPE